MTDRKKFAQWVAELTELCGSLYPVTVHLVRPGRVPPRKKKDNDGHCSVYAKDGKPQRFVIHVANNQLPHNTALTLEEEFAHVLRYHIYGVEPDAEGHDSIYDAIRGYLHRNWYLKAASNTEESSG